MKLCLGIIQKTSRKSETSIDLTRGSINKFDCLIQVRTDGSHST